MTESLSTVHSRSVRARTSLRHRENLPIARDRCDGCGRSAGSAWSGRNTYRILEADGERRESLSQAVMDGKRRRGGAVITGRFVEDMGEVISNRFLTQVQFLGDLQVRQPLRYQSQYLHLSRR